MELIALTEVKQAEFVCLYVYMFVCLETEDNEWIPRIPNHDESQIPFSVFGLDYVR